MLLSSPCSQKESLDFHVCSVGGCSTTLLQRPSGGKRWSGRVGLMVKSIPCAGFQTLPLCQQPGACWPLLGKPPCWVRSLCGALSSTPGILLPSQGLPFPTWKAGWNVELKAGLMRRASPGMQESNVGMTLVWVFSLKIEEINQSPWKPERSTRLLGDT